MALSKEEHTVKRYDQQLAHLRNLVLEMGGMVEDQVNQAVRALDDEDLNGARQVIARDYLVNGLEVKADEEVANLIALRQPLGSDLRFIISLSKTVTDLERVGDEAERIARMVVHIYDSDAGPPNSRLFRDVVTMAQLASKMLHNALDALARLEVGQALEITRGDHELDQEFQSGLRRLATYMMEDPRTVGHAINIVFMLRSLERIGDHAKNIAEYVIYMVKGKDVRHTDKSKLEPDVLPNNR